MKSILVILASHFFANVCFANEDLENPRIPHGEFTEDENSQILEKVNALKGTNEECLNTFISDYQRSLYDYCEATNGGENIGGGCAHVAYAWSVTSSVLEQALNSCK